MNFFDKKIGIWGLGIVGKSAIAALHNRSELCATDSRQLSESDHAFLTKHHCSFIPPTQLEQFLSLTDYILPSPGIDLRPFVAFADKFICEVDIFQQFFTKPTIAITGTLGKTTVTYLLSQLLGQHVRTATGGNIGIGMLDLMMKDDVDLAVLELSSFQLEHAKEYSPRLAIITNLYPNHLDRHGDIDSYRNAKLTMCMHQNKNQHALLPISFAPYVQNIQSKIAYFSLSKPTTLCNAPIYCIESNAIVRYENGIQKKLIEINDLPQIGMLEHWLIMCAALDILHYSLTLPKKITIDQTLEHRVEFCGSKNGISFYNDSKSTIMESTLAAVTRLQSQPIILLIGGLSKGVNREPYIAQLKDKIKYLICFGAEAAQLHAMATPSNISSVSCATLEDAVNHAYKIATPGDAILLSPGGSSFDLFKNYKERGEYFKKLIMPVHNSSSTLL